MTFGGVFAIAKWKKSRLTFRPIKCVCSHDTGMLTYFLARANDMNIPCMKIGLLYLRHEVKAVTSVKGAKGHKLETYEFIKQMYNFVIKSNFSRSKFSLVFLWIFVTKGFNMFMWVVTSLFGSAMNILSWACVGSTNKISSAMGISAIYKQI